MTPVIIVGLGDIAGVHIRVLEQVPGAEVVAGVDTADRTSLQFRGHAIPAYSSVAQAARHHDGEVVVIATPTASHRAVCDEAVAAFPRARLLVEKPAAATLADARHIIGSLGARQEIDIAYHMSFSPEVDWGVRVSRERAAELGRVTEITASFADPYSTDTQAAQARFGSSWIDSGINSLSILNRFASITERLTLRNLGDQAWSAFEARLTCVSSDSPAPALILTNWNVSDPAKTTTIRYDSGAMLTLDHTAVAGYLIRDQQVSAIFGLDASTPRRERHYLGLYRHWLTEGRPIASRQTHLALHELLLRPAG